MYSPPGWTKAGYWGIGNNTTEVILTGSAWDPTKDYRFTLYLMDSPGVRIPRLAIGGVDYGSVWYISVGTPPALTSGSYSEGSGLMFGSITANNDGYFQGVLARAASYFNAWEARSIHNDNSNPSMMRLCHGGTADAFGVADGLPFSIRFNSVQSQGWINVEQLG